MAAFDTTRTNYGAASIADHVAGFFNTLFSSVATWNDGRMTRKALWALTDRELEDIGLCRGDIETVVYGR